LKAALSILRLLFTIPFLATIASGQLSTSSIAGVVLDASGAAVGDARVSAMSEATGISYEGRTASAGAYTISYVSPGFYTLTISKQGFRSFRSTHNILTVGAPLIVDATLAVGPASEAIQVESSYERLNTTSANVSDLTTPKQIVNLPLNGRNPLTLLTLEPGVTQQSINAAGSDTHVFGSRDRSFNITIDSIDANDAAVPDPQNNIQRINPDNVQEYRSVTLNPTAELGRNSGANVMITTKAGGNGFHGALFYFLRNTAFNANEWFRNYEGLARPILHMNQYGFQIDGPIVKNKTFFSGSFQKNLVSQTVPIAQAFGIPILYSPTLLKTGVFRYLRGSVNVGGRGVSGNSPLLVDSKGDLKSGVPNCGTVVSTNCVDSYDIFANDPLGIGADLRFLACSTPCLRRTVTLWGMA